MRLATLLLFSSLASGQTQISEVTSVNNCRADDGDAQVCQGNGLEFEVESGQNSTVTSYSGCHAHGEELHCTGSGTDTTLHLIPTITAVTDCHSHGNATFCMAGKNEYEVISGGSSSATSYSGCHAHGTEIVHCSGEGYDVSLRLEGRPTHENGTSHDNYAHGNADEDEHGHDNESSTSTTTSSPVTISNLPAGVSCHEHAGVPHCVDAQGNTVELGCTRPEGDYNIPLRIGAIFAILVTSTIGVLLPIFLVRFAKLDHNNVVFIIIRQFGTGVVISTAIVHLFTHAQIYFSNECLTGLNYEATAGAILIAGLFLAFLFEYIAKRLIYRQQAVKETTDGDSSDEEANLKEKISSTNTLLLEAGLIFHSILIGITLVVATSSFIVLFVVIIFHQMFEGLALGARLAMLSKRLLPKLLLAMAFAITTPVGMAIGIGVLSSFNGNDPSTIIAIGTINAFSAGILLWIGIVEMWYEEWWKGALANASPLKTGLGLLSLISGLVLMSLLGKWA